MDPVRLIDMTNARAGTMFWAWENGADTPGDLYLFHRLLKLAGEELNYPLLACQGDTSQMRFCEAVLTPFGEAVLAGSENANSRNGIDDWVGGVRLFGPDPAAVREGDRLVVAE